MNGQVSRWASLGVAILTTLLCAGCAAQIPAHAPLNMAAAFNPGPVQRTPEIVASPPAYPPDEAGRRAGEAVEPEGYLCLDGSRLQVSYSSDRVLARVSVNGARAIVMRRDDEDGITAYRAESIVFLRSGPRAVVTGGREVVTVVRGDTLGDIAQRIYGERMRAADIARANAALITNADLIFPGQVLRLPAVERRCRRAQA